MDYIITTIFQLIVFVCITPPLCGQLSSKEKNEYDFAIEAVISRCQLSDTNGGLPFEYRELIRDLKINFCSESHLIILCHILNNIKYNY